MVKELRERTGAGMMECKKALQETSGDIDLAIENMRKAGQAKADKKANRTAAEGVIVISTSDDHKNGVMIEVNCETDFVAKDSGFNEFTDNLVAAALSNNVSSLEDLLGSTLTTGETVEEARKNLIVKIGENINVRRLAAVKSDNGHVGYYIHGGRIGVILEMEGGSEALGKDIAMHIAASNPLVVSPEDVPSDVVEKEKDIFQAQASQSGKPAEIIEKMISGRIKKFLDEVSLLGQAYVKDPSMTVAKLLKAENATVKSFVRYQVGEGIDKKEDNFAEEVMSQVNSAG